MLFFQCFKLYVKTHTILRKIQGLKWNQYALKNHFIYCFYIFMYINNTDDFLSRENVPGDSYRAQNYDLSPIQFHTRGTYVLNNNFGSRAARRIIKKHFDYNSAIITVNIIIYNYYAIHVTGIHYL